MSATVVTIPPHELDRLAVMAVERPIEAIIGVWAAVLGELTKPVKVQDWAIPAEQWDAMCAALSRYDHPREPGAGAYAVMEWIDKGPSRAEPSPELTSRL